MSVKALMSAAHAAGYVMAPQELPQPEPRALLKGPEPDPVAAVRRAVPAVIPAQPPTKSDWIRELLSDYWPGRATA